MKILIVYATTDVQTRKIARFAADRLCDAGHNVELVTAAETEGLDLSRFDAAVLAGSIHAGHFQDNLQSFAKASAEALGRLPTLFLSVSLSAAGTDEKDWEGIHAVVTEFQKATGWTPGRVEHVAGAFRFTQYDFFKSWAMRWIAHQKKQEVDSERDTEYTDWEKLAVVLADWVPFRVKAA